MSEPVALITNEAGHTKRLETAIKRCIEAAKLDIAPREDLADWLAQVVQVLISGNWNKDIQIAQQAQRIAELERELARMYCLYETGQEPKP